MHMIKPITIKLLSLLKKTKNMKIVLEAREIDVNMNRIVLIFFSI